MDLSNSNITKLVDSLFVPTVDQREFKAKLLIKIKDNPTVNLETLTLQQAKSFVKEWRLAEWWHEAGFREWLSNSDEFRQKLEFVLGETLEEIYKLILDPEASSQSKVRAFEIMARLAGKEPPKVKEVKFKDSEVEKMDEQQLDEFIRKHSKGA